MAALLPAETGQLTLTRDTVVSDPRTDERLPGCVLRLVAGRSAFGTGPLPDQRVRDGLAALGWREHLQYGADGPDGTAFALWRESATCFGAAQWDGGDDADPSYVPRDDYLLVVGCVTGP